MERARLTIEVDQTELARLSEAARDHDVRLDKMTGAEFIEIWAAGIPPPPPAASIPKGPTEAAVTPKPSREMRRAAIASVHGMWKNDPSKQQDGLEYEREVRAES